MLSTFGIASVICFCFLWWRHSSVGGGGGGVLVGPNDSLLIAIDRNLIEILCVFSAYCVTYTIISKVIGLFVRWPTAC